MKGCDYVFDWSDEGKGKVPCPNQAKVEIWNGPEEDSVTVFACSLHVDALIDDPRSYGVMKIRKESKDAN